MTAADGWLAVLGRLFWSAYDLHIGAVPTEHVADEAIHPISIWEAVHELLEVPELAEGLIIALATTAGTLEHEAYLGAAAESFLFTLRGPRLADFASLLDLNSSLARALRYARVDEEENTEVAAWLDGLRATGEKACGT